MVETFPFPFRAVEKRGEGQGKKLAKPGGMWRERERSNEEKWRRMNTRVRSIVKRTTNNRDLCGSGDRKVYKRKRDIAKGGDRWMEGGKKRGRKMGKGGRETNGGVKRFGTRYVNTDVTGSSHGIRIQAKFDFSSRYRVFREWKIVEIYFYLLCFLVVSWMQRKVGFDIVVID